MSNPHFRESPSVFPQPAAAQEGGRSMVLCFDGTGNMFGENSNVVRFCEALVKDQTDRQIVYYQPGIGTYNENQFYTRSISAISMSLDKGLAIHLNDHVKEGYLFIMKNYRKGDRICLFGFSRGAHTARVIAGMLYKVGLLPPHNDQQLNFAFSIYQATGFHGTELSRLFKKTFAIPVTVEFVGVWDTVSSVGIIPRRHPYTSVNYAVKTFRHALALDERRARFRPQTWHEPTLEREQDLDVDEPRTILKPRGSTSRDDWVYEPPDRTTADVQEVWFAGAHADIGGGSHSISELDSLAFIPLRWMVKECLIKGTGILFDQEVLSSYGFDFAKLEECLTPELNNHGLSQFGFGDRATHEAENAHMGHGGDPLGTGQTTPTSSSSDPPSYKSESPTHESSSGLFSLLQNIGSGVKNLHFNPELKHKKDGADCIARIYDQLDSVWMWWILEYIPTLSTYQKADGTWVRKRTNFGKGRYIPFCGDKVLVHNSVEEKIRTGGYEPAASNWDIVVKSGMLEYVY